MKEGKKAGAMTGAERMRRYRQKRKELGKIDLSISPSESVVRAVDLYRRETGQTRSEAIDDIVNDFLKHWAEDCELMDYSIKEVENDDR